MDKWTREYYLSRLASYPSTYKSLSPSELADLAHPKPPYKDEEVPIWWPQFLRKYLTEVSRESFYGFHPCIIHVPRDPKLTMEQTIINVRGEAIRDMEPEIMSDPDLIKMYLENEELYGLSITVGNRGCTFSDQCDLRTGKIYYHCYDDRSYGIEYYHQSYVRSDQKMKK